MPKSVCFNKRNDFLKCIAVLTANANQVGLDRSLNFLLRVLDDLDDLSRLLNRNPLLHGDSLAYSRASRRHNGAVGKRFQRHSALHQLPCRHVIHCLQLKFVRGDQHQPFFFVDLDIGFRVLQVVASVDFLQRLLDGIRNFLQIDFTDNVE